MAAIFADISATLEQLKQTNAHRINPAHFSFIETLLTKSQNANANTQVIIHQKLSAELSLYAEQVERNQAAASENKVELEPPISAIAALSLQLSKPDEAPVVASDNLSLSETIALHETNALKKYNNGQAVQAKKSASKPELKAFNSFKQFKEKYDSDKLVEQLINDRPEQLGPLNPQLLLIKSVASMKDLSPHYLSRFVTYIDTLLRLEDASKLKPAKHKKKRQKKTTNKE